MRQGILMRARRNLSSRKNFCPTWDRSCKAEWGGTSPGIRLRAAIWMGTRRLTCPMRTVKVVHLGRLIRVVRATPTVTGNDQRFRDFSPAHVANAISRS